MNNPFFDYETNKDHEQKGKWYPKNGYRALLARNGGSNTEYYKELLEEKDKTGKLKYEDLSLDEQINLTKKVFCKTVLLKHQIQDESGEWQDGVWIKDGDKIKTVPDTVENRIICMEQLPDYYSELSKVASDRKTFRTYVIEEQEKN